jgi:hypothetical protein
MVLSPPVASSAFHSASPIYSRVEKSSANTPASSTNRFDIDKGSDTELTIENRPAEYHRKLEAINMKMEEAFMACYNVTSQGLVLRDTKSFVFDIYKAMSEVEITVEQNYSSDDVQSSDCISVPSGNGSASILGRILLQIPRSSRKTRMICITQKQVQPRIIKRIRLVMGLLKKPAILLPTLIWLINKLVVRLVQTR